MGYSLWKQTKDNASTQRDNRQDYYLYGHGSGKRFRSPNQFLPHLLWLAKEANGDCPCEICSGVERKEKKDLKKETDAEMEAESSQELAADKKGL
jgi:Transcription-silencing protein, cryptic loci regulator Clr2